MIQANDRKVKDVFWQIADDTDLPLAVKTVSEKEALTPMHSHLFQELAVVKQVQIGRAHV